MERKSLLDTIVEKKRSHLQTGKDGLPKKIFTTVQEKIYVKKVDPGLRFAHWIADGICYSIISYLISVVPAKNDLIVILIGIISIVSYPLYYALFEYFLQQTPGKMLTNSMVIDKFADKPDFKTCLLRAVIRFVPFEPFSCLGTPSWGWHDKWADTFVVKKSVAIELKKTLENINVKTSEDSQI